MKSEDVIRSRTIVEAIKPFLSGQGPGVQGAVLADLVSLWVAGHHPSLRTEVISTWLVTMTALVEPSEKELFGDAGFPEHLQ